LIPDITFLLDIPAEEGLLRRKQHGGWNRLDAYNLEFHERVRQGYLALAQAEPQRWLTIDGRQSVEAIQQELQRLLAARLPTLQPPA
jgi:dTMP kinase